MTWDSVCSLIEATKFPSELRVLAEEFQLVLTGVVLKESVEITSELAASATAFLDRVAAELSQRVVVAKIGAIAGGKDYRGRYFSFSGATGSDFRLWIAVTEKHAQYNQPLHGQTVWVSSADNETLSLDVQERLESAGFSWLKDRAGWTRWPEARPWLRSETLARSRRRPRFSYANSSLI